MDCLTISRKSTFVFNSWENVSRWTTVSPFTARSPRFYPYCTDESAGVKLIRGRYVGDGMLDISPRTELTLRLAASDIAQYINLAGKRLDILGQTMTVGVPMTRALVPAVALYAHQVTTKNGHDQNRFEEEIARQMATSNVKGKFAVGKRRTFGIHGKQVVGYSMLVSELTAEESIILQENGLGGRRKMGCGFFEPWKE